MRIMSFIFFTATIPLFFYSEIDAHSTTALKLLSLTQHIPFPAWAGTATLAVFGLLFSRKKTVSKTSFDPPRTQKSQLTRHKRIKSDPARSWEDRIKQQLDDLDIPPSAKFILDKKVNVPFTLLFERSTQMAIKRGVSELARFLSQNPKPQRVEIVLNQPIKGGAPLQNVITGALRQHLNIHDYHLTSQEDGFDVQFKDPQEPWISQGNISQKFYK